MALKELFSKSNHDPVITLVKVTPDPDLAARNAARIEERKAQMGDKYICFRPITLTKEAA